MHIKICSPLIPVGTEVCGQGKPLTLINNNNNNKLNTSLRFDDACRNGLEQGGSGGIAMKDFSSPHQAHSPHTRATKEGFPSTETPLHRSSHTRSDPREGGSHWICPTVNTALMLDFEEMCNKY